MAVVAVVGVAMWLIRLPDIGNQTVRSKPDITQRLNSRAVVVDSVFIDYLHEG